MSISLLYLEHFVTLAVVKNGHNLKIFEMLCVITACPCFCGIDFCGCQDLKYFATLIFADEQRWRKSKFIPIKNSWNIFRKILWLTITNWIVGPQPMENPRSSYFLILLGETLNSIVTDKSYYRSSVQGCLEILCKLHVITQWCNKYTILK